MFGLLKVLAAIFYVIEDITFKTRQDTCRGSRKKKGKRVARCVQNQREEEEEEAMGLNTACSDSHGFRLVKSIAFEIRPNQI